MPLRWGIFKTKFEFDMFGVGSDEGKTTIRLRHAYGELGQFLAGQTNSLFMDIDVFPNTIDYRSFRHGLLSQRPGPLDALLRR